MSKTHKVEIKVEAPREEGEKSFSRHQVFYISLESPLEVSAIQNLTNKFFTDLTMAALSKETST